MSKTKYYVRIVIGVLMVFICGISTFGFIANYSYYKDAYNYTIEQMTLKEEMSNAPTSGFIEGKEALENPHKFDSMFYKGKYDQQLRELRESYAEVQKETSAVMATVTARQRDVDKYKADVARINTAAENALKAGNEADALTLISQKQQAEANLASVQKNLEVATANADKMKAMHNKLRDDINSLDARRANVKANVAMAEATERVNGLNIGNKTSAAMSKFEDMEAKAQAQLDQAMAAAELNGSTATEPDLVAQYSSGSTASAQDELAAMKARLGL